MTQRPRSCPRCRRPVDRCHCAARIAANTAPAGDGIVRVRREVQGGKTQTVVLGLPLRADELADVARQLKQKCGAGGSVVDGAVLVQGDHRETIVAWLQAKGHTVKLAGG